MRLPCPRAMINGSPPTAFHARTGLLTPPGIFSRARQKIFLDRDIVRKTVANIALLCCQHDCRNGEKKFVDVFFLQRILKRTINNASEIKAHRRRFSFPRREKTSTIKNFHHMEIFSAGTSGVSIGVLWIARLSTSRQAMGLSAILVIHNCG